jgi:hypothetical protein
MSEIMIWASLAAAEFAGFCVLAFAGLKGWQGWLELKRSEMGQKGSWTTAERIELADLKERVRKLESIASFVDL